MDEREGGEELLTSVSLTDKYGSLRTFKDIESDVIELALKLCDGNMTYVANRLGIGRSTLYRKTKFRKLKQAAPESVEGASTQP